MTDPAWYAAAKQQQWLDAAKLAYLDQHAPRDAALTAALIAIADALEQEPHD